MGESYAEGSQLLASRSPLHFAKKIEPAKEVDPS